MNSQVALLLCILFIMIVFIIEYKRKTNVSNAIWISVVWIMIMGSRPLGHWLNWGSVRRVSETHLGYSEGSPFDMYVFLLLILIGFAVLLKRKIYLSKILQKNLWLFLLILYSMISILWSDFPFVSFKRWIKEIGNIIMVLIVLTEHDPFEATKTLIRRCAYLLIPLSVLLIKYYPNLGRIFSPWGTGEYVGVTTSKNMLGTLCLVCGLYFICSLFIVWREKKKLSIVKIEMFVHILFFLMILWLLKTTNSVTSFMCLVIYIILLVGMEIPIIKENVKFMWVFICLIIFVSFVSQMLLNVSGVLISTMGRDMTLTGRTDLWKGVIKLVENPLIGTGYESFWLGDRLKKLWEVHWWRPNQAHNGYLDIYLNLGLIGLLLLIGVILSAFKKLLKSLVLNFDYARFRIVFLIIALLYNFTESSFKGLSLIWFVFVLVVIEYPQPISQSYILGSSQHNKK